LMNAFVGAQFGPRSRSLTSLLAYSNDVVHQALKSLELVGLADMADRPSASLSLFDKKKLMLATALVAEPTLLLLDEPVGGLNPKEIAEFMQLVREIRSGGVTVIIIEHVMKVLMGLSDKVLFMHYGERFFEGSPEDASRDPQVLKVYLGEQFALQPKTNSVVDQEK
jgi:branched-chain amino acid transport system ATP-binding protein